MNKKFISDERKQRMEETFRQMNELTGNAEKDFPELFEEEKDIDEKQREYLKKAMIEDFIDNVEIREDNSISDKRLKRPLFKRIIESLFG